MHGISNRFGATQALEGVSLMKGSHMPKAVQSIFLLVGIGVASLLMRFLPMYIVVVSSIICGIVYISLNNTIHKDDVNNNSTLRRDNPLNTALIGFVFIYFIIRIVNQLDYNTAVFLVIMFCIALFDYVSDLYIGWRADRSRDGRR